MNTSSAPALAGPEAASVARFRWRILVLAALFIGLLLPLVLASTLPVALFFPLPQFQARQG